MDDLFWAGFFCGIIVALVCFSFGVAWGVLFNRPNKGRTFDAPKETP